MNYGALTKIGIERMDGDVINIEILLYETRTEAIHAIAYYNNQPDVERVRIMEN